MPGPSKLTLRSRPTPRLDALDELLRDQLGPLLDQADGDAELFELFDVVDSSGRKIYDMHLFCGDDGRVFHAGTTDYVASFSQGGATKTGQITSEDRALLAALDDALTTHLGEGTS
jgi:hypothetical protein